MPDQLTSHTLTGRQRLLQTLKGKPVDRIAIAPFLYYNAVYEMFDYRPRIDNFYDPADFDVVEKFIEYCDYFGFDVMHVPGSVWDQYLHGSMRDRSITESDENWDVKIVDEGDYNENINRTIHIKTPSGNLLQRETYKRTSKYLIICNIDECLIKTPADFDILQLFMPPADKMDCSLITRARKACSDKGLTDTNTHGAFNIVSMFRNVEQLMMDPLVDEGFYRAMVEFFLPRLIQRAGKMIQAGADVIEVAAQLAGSSVGPEFYRKYILDYENRLLKGIHELGGLTVFHNCGRARAIMHLYNEMDIDCWGYITPPPFGDVDLDEALRLIRPDMALRGNIDQVDFMVKASPQEVRERTREVVLKAKQRGNFILSTTDFFFDNTPYENIKAFADAGREYGTY
jgi:uroporphyrinogen decarboxylase